MHFYEFNIGDYAKKTQHLTNEEDLAYRRLLDMYYDTENPVLTTGLATLSRRLRVSEESLKNVLDEFFPDGKNKHADEKIADYHEYLKRQKANGSKGGRPKHKPTANPVLTQNNPVPSQPLTTKPLTTDQNNKPSCASPDGDCTDDAKSDPLYTKAFITFWEMYPRKKSKGDAAKAFAKLKASEYQAVRSGLIAAIASPDWQKDNGQFIPHPATWLRAKGWEDESVAVGGGGNDSFLRRIGAIPA